MFQFQLLVDRAGRSPGVDLGSMDDRELIEFIHSRAGRKEVNRSIARIEKRIDELKKELRSLNQRWITKRELAKRAEMSPIEQKIIHAEMSHLEERAQVIRERVISEMLEGVQALKTLLMDTTETGGIPEKGGILTDSKRKLIINTLMGRIE